MDGSVDGIGPSAPIPLAPEMPPPQEAPAPAPSEPEAPPVPEDSGKTLDLYV